MILGLRSVIYPAPDLARAKAWYEQVLGCAPYFDQPFYVGFNVGGFELGLLPDAMPGITGARPLWGVAERNSLCSKCGARRRKARVRCESVAYCPFPDGATLWASSTMSRSNLRG